MIFTQPLYAVHALNTSNQITSSSLLYYYAPAQLSCLYCCTNWISKSKEEPVCRMYVCRALCKQHYFNSQHQRFTFLDFLLYTVARRESLFVVSVLRFPFAKPRTTMCVCVFSSHSFWTSSSLDIPAGVTQEEGHTGFIIHLLSAVRALIFLARRIQPFLSLVVRDVEFCVLTI